MKKDYTHEFYVTRKCTKYEYFTVRANSMEEAKEEAECGFDYYDFDWEEMDYETVEIKEEEIPEQQLILSGVLQLVKCNPIEHSNKMEKLTHSKIIGMSDAELKDYIKQGFADVTEHDMIDKELYYRDQRRILID